MLVAGLLMHAEAAFAERNFSATRPPTAKVARAAPRQLTAVLPLALELGPLDPAAVAALEAGNEAPGARAFRLGVVRDTSKLAAAQSTLLAWRALPDGHAAQWRIGARGARALRIELAVARGAPGLLARFAPEDHPGEVYETRLPPAGRAWSPLLEGEGAIVELFAPRGVDPAALSVTLAGVAQHFADPTQPFAGMAAKSAATGSSCAMDVACVASADPTLARAASAVSRVTYVRDGYSWACTGTLLNPGDGSFAPYYLTAAHCVPDAATASTVSVLWFDAAPTCGGSTARDPVQSAVGAQLLVADPVLDGALLRLNEMPPQGAVYAGWDSLPIGGAMPVVAIHNPGGGVTKLSEGFASVSADERFLAASWSLGATAGGSSGSGLFTQIDSPRHDWLLRGTLVGGNSACTAAGPAGSDFYSRFDLAWPRLAPYLSAEAKGANFSGLWWNPAEPGWGLEVSHQQGAIMAALFGYGEDGTSEWLIGPQLTERSDGEFEGDLFRMSGPRFDAEPWSGSVAHTAGTMRVAFTAPDRGRVSFATSGAAIEKEIVPMVFSPTGRAVCSFTDEDRAVETNYQDLWWDPAESGWGIAIAHQADTLFAVLFTYADDGSPLWVAAPGLVRRADGRYAGTLYRTAGAALDAHWHAASATPAGDIALAFADGNSATVSYTLDGRAVSKPITRIAASPSAPACR